MHELAIAGHVVDIAARHADGRKVTKVYYLKVGPVEGAEMVLEEVPATGRCLQCGAESALKSFPLQCGACKGLSVEIIRGEELYVESLEMEEHQDDKI